MDSGERIRQLRKDRRMKPGDLESTSRTIAEINGCIDYHISATNLAEIENGLVPGIHQICTLATCFKIPYEQVLLIFGVDLRAEYHEINPSGFPAEIPKANAHSAGLQSVEAIPIELSKDGLDFRLNFHAKISLLQTRLLGPDPARWGNIPAALHKRLNPAHFRYAWVGLQDDTMADILPAGSLVEIDKKQKEVKRSAWTSLHERPLYLVRHTHGYSCCWCQLEENELTLVPNPLSQRKAIHFQTPQQATIVGKVVNIWMPRQLHNMRAEFKDASIPFSTSSYSSGFTAMFESGRID